jgi:lipid-binding SYLF domain-containing protein
LTQINTRAARGRTLSGGQITKEPFMIRTLFALPLAIILACALLPGPAAAQTAEKDKKAAQYRQQLHADVQAAIAQFTKVDPAFDQVLKQSAGYAVFARVGKVGFIIGGGHGDGELFDKGQVVGVASITMGNVGLTAGAQEFSEILVFKDAAALERFKQNRFEFAASASAVIVKAGAAKEARYSDGVAVFVRPSRGAMAEASLGGQKFNVKLDVQPAKQ